MIVSVEAVAGNQWATSTWDIGGVKRSSGIAPRGDCRRYSQGTEEIVTERTCWENLVHKSSVGCAELLGILLTTVGFSLKS